MRVWFLAGVHDVHDRDDDGGGHDGLRMAEPTKSQLALHEPACQSPP